MTDNERLWLRHEINPTEQRAPIAPVDAGLLTAVGVAITVEDSPQRVFKAADYAAAGCRIVEPGSWPDAPDNEYIVGLKEPGAEPNALRHRHLFFGHAYKGQEGAGRLLRRFISGGGCLFDLEYITDDAGRRVAAFGYWAGYVGAALAVLHARGQLSPPLRSLSKPELDAALAPSRGQRGAGDLRAVVIGALGRCGRGACGAFAAAGVATTRWDLAETRELDRKALLDHDILVNAVLTTDPTPAFLTHDDLGRPDRRLAVISDVTCDVTSDRNLLPIYGRPTDWQRPALRLRPGPPSLDLIAIDNLPSLLPLEASLAFSTGLTPYLRSLGATASGGQRALELFHVARSAEAARMEETDA